MGVDDFVRIIDMIDDKSHIVSKVSDMTKKLLAMDPDALNNDLAEHMIRSHLGDPMYDIIQNIYHDFINANIAPQHNEEAKDCQDASADVNITYFIREKGG